MSMIGIIVSILVIFSLFVIAARGGLQHDENSGDFEQDLEEEEDEEI
ncbi:hypothetical protein [Phocicoccus pinnipedialis]|uniref:Uncharacterized protein n=1 Tax=Phocicoccus pinnipedialis TaxID=110845 RepID=A0A6V7R4W1_9BACL|nr:hypothetical protein [Jeotgalicoccus pinnipedialis]MBP1940004.1 hypothetical protein [Jeotgalicoccus pinnipedialis]CAD2072048.1 hypothetical protein JEOPIN946_00246 [Jeotgalicoccus pinnipedialis]